MVRKIYKIMILIMVLLINLRLDCLYAEEIDVNTECRLELTYEKDGNSFQNMEIRLYQIANVLSDGSFEKVSPFDMYPVAIDNVKTKEQWYEIASTFRGYIQADQILPYRSEMTDLEGNVEFEKLEPGLYYVDAVMIENGDSLYNFYEFMVCMPMMKEEQYVYEVIAKPKAQMKEIDAQERIYRIIKLWEDEENREVRPESITVDILQDGIYKETVILSADTEWTYQFTCSDGKSKYAVIERNVSEEYTVKVIEKEETFLIINTLEDNEHFEEAPVYPQTGDSMSVYSWSACFCLSGLLLVILGIGLRRKENAK